MKSEILEILNMRITECGRENRQSDFVCGLALARDLVMEYEEPKKFKEGVIEGLKKMINLLLLPHTMSPEEATALSILIDIYVELTEEVETIYGDVDRS